MKKIFWFTILVIFFMLLITFSKGFLLSMKEETEENYIEKSVYMEEEADLDYIALAKAVIEENQKKEEKEAKKQFILEKLERIKQGEKLEKEKEKKEEIVAEEHNHEVHFHFVPEDFSSAAESDKNLFSDLLVENSFKDFVKKITISFYKERVDVRGKMKSKTIKLFGPQSMEEDELLAIFIHEFAHYIDLYFLERVDKADISNEFYDISWYSTIVMNPGLEGKDFVSGYAMTNKYEDFAETLTYYIFHNNDFVKKAQKSDILLSKYNFITQVIFGDNTFVGTDFSEANVVKSYYRDITKIDFSKKNFLQYVKNSI